MVKRLRTLVVRCALLALAVWGLAVPVSRMDDPVVAPTAPAAAGGADPLEHEIELYTWRRRETEQQTAPAVDAAARTVDWLERGDRALHRLFDRVR